MSGTVTFETPPWFRQLNKPSSWDENQATSVQTIQKKNKTVSMFHIALAKHHVCFEIF